MNYKIGDCRKLVPVDKYEGIAHRSEMFYTPLESDNYRDIDVEEANNFGMILIKDKTVCSKLIRIMHCES